MGRKTLLEDHNDKLMAATAEAARILTSDIALVSATMQDHLRSAVTTKNSHDAACWLKIAKDLMGSQVELVNALAKVKGERRYQHIRVERAPKSTAIAPESVTNFAAEAEENPSETAENRTENGAQPGGEGGLVSPVSAR